MTAPLGELFAATDIDFRAGWVDTIDAGKGVISLKGVDGAAEMLPYDRLVVAAGSHGFQPPIPGLADFGHSVNDRSEEHTSELQSLMRISYAVFCLKKKKKT